MKGRINAKTRQMISAAFCWAVARQLSERAKCEIPVRESDAGPWSEPRTAVASPCPGVDPNLFVASTFTLLNTQPSQLCIADVHPCSNPGEEETTERASAKFGARIKD
jgi:hypothetical protein